MRGFIFGVVMTVLVITGGVFAVSQFGSVPDRRRQSSRLNRARDRGPGDGHLRGEAQTGGRQSCPGRSASLMEGAKEYEEHCAFCHGGAKATISPMRDKFNPPTPQLINRIPHDDDAWLFWVTKHGVRMTGMPAWDGILSDEEMWKVIAFIKHSDKLPPDVQSAWQRMAATPGEIEEHTPEQHEHVPAKVPDKR